MAEIDLTDGATGSAPREPEAEAVGVGAAAQTGEAAQTGTGSAGTGSAGTGSAGTGSAGTGSAAPGQRRALSGLPRRVGGQPLVSRLRRDARPAPDAEAAQAEQAAQAAHAEQAEQAAQAQQAARAAEAAQAAEILRRSQAAHAARVAQAASAGRIAPGGVRPPINPGQGAGQRGPVGPVRQGSGQPAPQARSGQPGYPSQARAPQQARPPQQGRPPQYGQGGVVRPPAARPQQVHPQQVNRQSGRPAGAPGVVRSYPGAPGQTTRPSAVPPSGVAAAAAAPMAPAAQAALAQAAAARAAVLHPAPAPAPAPVDETLPRYLQLVRKEARVRQDQADWLASEVRRINSSRRRRDGVVGERITDNTLIRVALDLLRAQGEALGGTTEDELVRSVLP